MTKRIFSMHFLVAVLIGITASSVATADISSIVVYGDSLSDNGNLFNAAHYPPAPYFDGRFSNGPVAVELMAQTLAVPLIDFAWGGATTGIGNYVDGGNVTTAKSLPGMQTVFASTEALVPSFAGALFVVWGGPNDFFAPSPLDTTTTERISRSVANLMFIVNGLEANGATNILVPGMPDIGLTPAYEAAGPAASAYATAYTDAFNAALVAALPAGVKYADTASLTRLVVANPASFGLTNVTLPCFDGSSVCANPDQYAFWDGVHPTAQMSALLAQDFLNVVQTPEPGTIVLFGSVVLLAGIRALRVRRQ